MVPIGLPPSFFDVCSLMIQSGFSCTEVALGALEKELGLTIQDIGLSFGDRGLGQIRLVRRIAYDWSGLGLGAPKAAEGPTLAREEMRTTAARASSRAEILCHRVGGCRSCF